MTTLTLYGCHAHKKKLFYRYRVEFLLLAKCMVYGRSTIPLVETQLVNWFVSGLIIEINGTCLLLDGSDLWVVQGLAKLDA